MQNYTTCRTGWLQINFLWIFLRVGVKIWNGIPQIPKERPKKAFKRSLKAMLLDILQTEDSYADVDTIIVKMKT